MKLRHRIRAGILCQVGMGDDRLNLRPNRVPYRYPIWAARQAGCPGAQNFYYGY